MSKTVILQYGTHGGLRCVEVRAAGSVSGEPSLILHFDLCSDYDLLLKTNRLVYAKTNRRITRVIPWWRAVNIEGCWLIYNALKEKSVLIK